MNAKAGEHRRSEICGLDVTISARYDWSVASFHYVIGISGILPYSRNVTLQQECTEACKGHSRCDLIKEEKKNSGVKCEIKMRNKNARCEIKIRDVR